MTAVARPRTRAASGAWTPFMVRRPRSWGLDLAVAAAFIVLSALLVWPSAVVELDVHLRDLSDANRPQWAERIAVNTNKLGQGGLLGGLALGVSAILAHRLRTVRPMIAFLAVYGMTGSVLVVKYVLTRVYPHWPDPATPPYADAEQSTLFTVLEPAGAYPSGHVLNTIVWYGFLVFLLGSHLKTWQRRLVLLAPPVIVTFSTTYLGYHWLTDAAGGFLIGVVIIRLVYRIRWDTVELPTWLEPEKRYL
ncbi:MAG TPA: phosphatase PAP2 family protein [Glycomyces sp.]|nr:phosphatase PAP2 family protein [Glycomyces sp.]